MQKLHQTNSPTQADWAFKTQKTQGNLMEKFSLQKLTNLQVGSKARVAGFVSPDVPSDVENSESKFFESCVARLIEMGITKGTTIRICHKAPFGGAPIAIEIHGNRVGLGKDECNLVLAEPLPRDKDDNE